MIRKYLPLSAIAAVLTLVLLTGCKPDDSSSQAQQTTVVATQSSTSDDSTVGSDFDSRPSDAPRINVKLVEQALTEVQQKDSDGWVSEFRQRVNEIYDGDDVVSIDAHPDTSNNLQIVGYISHSGKEGFQDGDDQIFSIEQTGAVANEQTPYRLTYTTYGGDRSYYDGYYHNSFLMDWYVDAVVYHSWHGYYTSPTHITVLHDYRNTYRATPAYQHQLVATHAYNAETYHGATVTVHPGTSIGAGVTIKPTASVAPAHVTAPPAFVPSKLSTGSTAGATANHADHSGTTSSPGSSGKTAAPLETRSGGLFNKDTFGGGAKTSSAPKSSSAPRTSTRSGKH
jgi:hypothetical protein